MGSVAQQELPHPPRQLRQYQTSPLACPKHSSNEGPAVVQQRGPFVAEQRNVLVVDSRLHRLMRRRPGQHREVDTGVLFLGGGDSTARVGTRLCGCELGMYLSKRILSIYSLYKPTDEPSKLA